MQDIVAYGVRRADLVGGLVRVELTSVECGERGEPREVVAGAVHLPLAGFLRLAATVDGLMRQLVAAGAVVPTGGAEAPARPPAASPNFPAEG